MFTVYKWSWSYILYDFSRLSTTKHELKKEHVFLEGASADDDYDDEDDDYTTKKGKIKARCKGKQKKGQQKQIRNKIRNLPTRRRYD